MLDAARSVGLTRHPPSPDVVRANPLGYIAFDLEAQRLLAALLERLADALPDAVNPSEAALGAALLRDMATRRATPVESGLFPLLERHLPADTPALRAILVARRELETLTGVAVGLVEELDALVRTGRAHNPDALGFMLQVFFEGVRRRADWIDAAILPQARLAMGPREMARLGDRLAALAARPDAQCARLFRVIEGGPA